VLEDGTTADALAAAVRTLRSAWCVIRALADGRCHWMATTTCNSLAIVARSAMPAWHMSGQENTDTASMREITDSSLHESGQEFNSNHIRAG